MSESNDHLDPKEATEAKLCAYLEGELAPTERAEIEQHLTVNPQHRQLLGDLAKTRDWMRSIPSESSPVDLAELFQGQAERSMLLDEVEASSRMMIRMPQFLMVAAIMLLTVGLGVVVVVMLKGPKAGANRNFSLAPAGSTPAVTGSATTEPADQPHAMDADKLGKAKDAEAMAPAGITAPSPVMPLAHASAAADVADGAAHGLGVGGLTETKGLGAGARRDRAPANDLDVDAVKMKLVQSGYRLPIGQKTFCFVISADSPPTTDEQVRGFFTRHQLAFDNAITGKRETAVFYAAAGGKYDATKSGGGGAGGNLNKASTQSLALNGANNNSTVPAGSAGNAQNEATQVPGDNFQNNSQQQPAAGDNSRSLLSTPARIPVLTPATGPAGEQIYVAHGLSPLQFNLLSASLSTDNLNQSVKQLTLSEGLAPAQPTTAPTGAVTKGQTLTVTVPQLVGPGIDKTNVVKVADDGTIALPMIDPLPAAGIKPEELERKIADKYREANLIPEATVTVLAAAPTTQPLAAATQPTSMPSTQPAMVQNTPAAPKLGVVTVDVVVVIEKSSSLLPTVKQ